MENNDKKTISIHSKDKGKNRFEVNGVIMYAPNHNEAIRKYLRKGKPLKPHFSKSERSGDLVEVLNSKTSYQKS